LAAAHKMLTFLLISALLVSVLKTAAGSLD
jgi:hypothetical protein